MLAYNCSPSFNWKANLKEDTIATFRDRTRRDGLSLPVHHAGRFPHAQPRHVHAGARLHAARGMAAYADFQEKEFASENKGYTATRHQREVGTGYFDEVAKIVGGGQSSTTALAGSTEEEQFTAAGHTAH